MNIWVTSDTHFRHNNVIAYCKRPFTDIDHMTEVLVSNWNTLVCPNDTVYLLGDFSLSKSALDTVKHLNGQIHLIAGNHDHCHPVSYKKEEKGERMRQLYFDAGFKTIQLERDIVIADQIVKMHHMPYSGDHTDAGERYTEWRPVNKGGWLLHGHVHDLWKIKDKQINVGVDVWDYKPVHLDQIEQIIMGAV